MGEGAGGVCVVVGAGAGAGAGAAPPRDQSAEITPAPKPPARYEKRSSVRSRPSLGQPIHCEQRYEARS